MLSQIHRAKLIQIFSQHPKHQQGSPGCGSFDLLSGRYGSKVTPVILLDAEKIADVVLLYVSTMAFPASLFKG